MPHFFPYCVCSIFAITFLAAVSGTNSRSIPLDQVLTNGMPGTHNIRTSKRIENGRVMAEILQRSLMNKVAKKPAGQGFVVQGVEREAIDAVNRKFQAKEASSNSVSAGKETWIVFFSAKTN